MPRVGLTARHQSCRQRYGLWAAVRANLRNRNVQPNDTHPVWIHQHIHLVVFFCWISPVRWLDCVEHRNIDCVIVSNDCSLFYVAATMLCFVCVLCTLRPCAHWQFYLMCAPFAICTRPTASVHSASEASGASGTLGPHREVFAVGLHAFWTRESTSPIRQRCACLQTDLFLSTRDCSEFTGCCQQRRGLWRRLSIRHIWHSLTFSA